MPLTEFQRGLLAELAATPNDDRYLAGGAAGHFAPNSIRYGDGLECFHDSEGRVASAFATDRARLNALGYDFHIELSLPGFVRAVVSRDGDTTRIDWAHDSAWRFMPLVRDPLGGLLLHPIDLALNKTLTLAGRDEPRDFVDILFVHETVLALAGLCWAAPGKDPGLTPLSLLELLKRRGRYHQEDFARLQWAGKPVDLIEAKETWLAALSAANAFARERPADEGGCLYYSRREKRFVLPRPGSAIANDGIVPHYGAPGGVLPRPTDERVEDL